MHHGNGEDRQGWEGVSETEFSALTSTDYTDPLEKHTIYLNGKTITLLLACIHVIEAFHSYMQTQKQKNMCLRISYLGRQFSYKRN